MTPTIRMLLTTGQSLFQDKQELWSRQAKLAYPIKDGIPYMLENEARALSEEELKA